MTLFINESDFVGELKIDFGSFSDFNEFAATVQERYLKRLLGFELYLEMENDEAVDKMVDLIDGVADGFTDTDGTLNEVKSLKDMVKNFFFFEYQKDLQSHSTTIGEFEGLAENATKPESSAALNRKVVNAWNRAVEIWNQQTAFIVFKNDEQGSDYYPGFIETTIQKTNTFGI